MYSLSMQAPENGSQGTPGRQCAQFVTGPSKK